MPHFDLQDIEKSFHWTIVSRGRSYTNQDKVLEISYDGSSHLKGKVRGSSSRPYRVDIELEPRKTFTKLESDCTCPFGSQCKHGAALALYALAHKILPEQSNQDLVFPSGLSVSLEIATPPEIQNWLGKVLEVVLDPQKIDPAAKQRVLYRLQNNAGMVSVAAITRNILKSGGYGAVTEIKLASLISHYKPQTWTAFDIALLNDLYKNAPRINSYDSLAAFRLDGRHGDRHLREILNSERCLWQESIALKLGPPRRGKFEWFVTSKRGTVTPRVRMEQGETVLCAATPWYVDRSTEECGPIECQLPGEFVAALIRLDNIPPEHIAAVRTEFTRMQIPSEWHPPETLKVVTRAPEPVPHFAINFEVCINKSTRQTAPIAFGKLTFEYENLKAPTDGGDLRISANDEMVILRRNPTIEGHAKTLLQRNGWMTTSQSGWEIPKGRGNSFCIVPTDPDRPMDPVEKVGKFVEKLVPRLVGAGWKFEIEDNFQFVPESDVEWDISLDSQSDFDWFQFHLGIRVEGESFDLRPVLAQIFKEKGLARLYGTGPKRGLSDDVSVSGLNGRTVKLSRKRLDAILQPLLEIFGGVQEWPVDLRLPKAVLPDISKFEESALAANVPWKTSEELKRLSHLFKTFDRLEPVSAPPGFMGQLRGYQEEGLAWLQFLREFGFGGILADDMGLGKTVQVLAHILTEKLAGRMDRPCLIVAPTSTIPNWRRECERFAPDLKVISLQGMSRAARFAELASTDIALTTYPLLARDKQELAKAAYHLLVLDEAQNVKNPTTAAAKTVRELTARHRVCLSGTPVENHLGELWALFHFLMPGFLGSSSEFGRSFRQPIEKNGDPLASERLARRVRPFMLRRTKSQVVQELPAKTEIIESIEFDDPQRDLYESIRVAMDEKVRKLIAAQGFEKSHIQILDALLKLRQVCCDPRLVKLPSAKLVTVSAKLDRLMEMLGVLLEDGRRVLLFSQFTSMLDLIEERLRQAGITWVRISGDTIDRETPVQQFQAGKVPLFLISLKAGGTGLNLTAADTVILYDPWWNPAVENQAIDRAHRIGQEKAVIVYRLVASGTVEEKMLEMQARKSDIAKSILSDDSEGMRTLTANDLQWVLAPN